MNEQANKDFNRKILSIISVCVYAFFMAFIIAGLEDNEIRRILMFQNTAIVLVFVYLIKNHYK